MSGPTRPVPPPPPPRAPHDAEAPTSFDVPDEPPPAYEAQPNPATQEQTLQYGPSRPFQSATAPPPPPQPPCHPQPLGPYPISSLPPPNFPFWNGPNLSHQQTGFMPGPLNPPRPQGGAYPQQQQQQQQQGGSWAPPPHHPHSNHTAPSSTVTGSYAPPASPPPPSTTAPSSSSSTPNSAPNKYAPTTVATAGQPLLRHGQILVFPLGKDLCPKCQNTGYKPFVGTGGDDPNHPCRKCWDKFGRPFSGAIQIAALSDPTPPNYQRPLRPQPVYRPSTVAQFGGYPGEVYQAGRQRPVMQQQQGGQGMMYGQQGGGGQGIGYGGGPSHIHVTHQPPMGGGAIVLRPGDPRLGGMTCYRCGGAGITWGIFFQDETCELCRGVGRVFH